MERIISCDIRFGEFELVCAKCGKTILTMLSPEYAPAQLRHPPLTCNEDGSHSFAGQEKGELTYLSAPERKKDKHEDEMKELLSMVVGATKAVSDLRGKVREAANSTAD